MQALKALVIFMGVLIIVGMGLVAYGIAVKFGKVADGDDAPVAAAITGKVWPSDVFVGIPPRGRVTETVLDDGRMVVLVTESDGSGTLLVFDLSTGTHLGTIHLNSLLWNDDPVPQGDAK